MPAVAALHSGDNCPLVYVVLDCTDVLFVCPSRLAAGLARLDSAPQVDALATTEDPRARLCTRTDNYGTAGGA